MGVVIYEGLRELRRSRSGQLHLMPCHPYLTHFTFFLGSQKIVLLASAVAYVILLVREASNLLLRGAWMKMWVVVCLLLHPFSVLFAP